MSFDWFLPLLTLTALEIVLGIDNIVFIAILASRLPEEQRNKARILGLAAALVTRVILLFCIAWVLKLDEHVLFNVFDSDITGKDLTLLLGGIFLIGKATHEIHAKLEGPDEDEIGVGAKKRVPSMISVIVQIGLMDIVFSIDSVITAVGMADEIWIMVTAVIIAIGVMMIFARPISRFVERHPTVKMLALSFLLLIGVLLTAEGFDQHIPKGYIYFAMGFSLFVELLNLRMKKVSTEKAKLHGVSMPNG